METRKLAIIGSGPAGWTAGVYAGRAMLEPVLFAGFKSGGQLMYTTDVENYPGFKDGIEGPKMMFEMRAQAERFGTNIQDIYVTAVDFSQRPFKLWTKLPEGTPAEVFETGSKEELKNLVEAVKQMEPDWAAQSVVITTGAAAIMLGIPGEKELLARGVSTCAVCDAAFFKEKNTYVVGGGDSAMEDALALSRHAAKVTILHRREEFRASKIMQQRVFENEKIEVLWNAEVTEVIGEQKVEKLKLLVKGKEQEVQADGMFLAIGHRPMTRIFENELQLDEKGYIVTSQSLTDQGVEKAKFMLSEGVVRFPTMTSVEGVFAGGDNVDLRYRQAITAAGQGCSAAIDAERWLEQQGLS